MSATLGACLIANEPDGLKSSLLQARVDGKSWKQIADEFGYANPSAARSAFAKHTGITDFKIKGPKLKEMFDAIPGNTLADKAKDVAVAVDKLSPKQAKYIQDLLEKKGASKDLLTESLSKKEASQLIDQLNALPDKAVFKTKQDLIQELNDLQAQVKKFKPTQIITDQSVLEGFEPHQLQKFIEGFKETVEKQLGKSSVLASDEAQAAAKKAAKKLTKEDLLTPVDNTVLSDPQFKFISNNINNGKTYAQISQLNGMTIPEIDEFAWQHYLQQTQGDVWKAYLKKPTSHEGASEVVKLWQKAAQSGMTDEEFTALTGVDKGTLKVIKDGKFKPAQPGTATYYPPSVSQPAPFGSTTSSSFKPSTFAEPSGGSAGTVKNEFGQVSQTDLQNWLQSLGNDLTSEQLQAVRSYTGSDYFRLNNGLRDGKLKTSRTVRSIDESMRPTPFDLKVTRGVHGNKLGISNPLDAVGKVVTDDGFVSTSWGSGNFQGDFIYHIDVPKGTLARDVSPISPFKHEQELLLARGTKFMVQGVERRGNTWHVYMRVIANGVGR